MEEPLELVQTDRGQRVGGQGHRDTSSPDRIQRVSLDSPAESVGWARLTLALPLLALSACSQLVPHANAGIPFLERGAAGPIARGAKWAGWILGIPLSLALAPLAGLLAATPWIDLPLAVDIASAPALALGYVTEGLVGLPAYGVASLVDDGPAAAPAGAGDLFVPDRSVPWGFVVDHRELGADPRPAAPVTSATLADYAPTPAQVAALSAQLAAARGEDPYAIQIDLGFAATLEVYPATCGEGPRPLLFMTPPIRATFASRWLAERYADLGVHAVVMVPERTFLQPDLDARELEAKLHAAVVSGRAALAALRADPRVDPARTWYMGISAGAIYGAVLLALEPIDKSVLIFPGGDLPAIVTASTEAIVVRYREARERVGQPPEALRAALAAEVRTDPLRFAPHVDPRGLLLFLSAHDTKVPIANQLALRRALGRPETWLLAGDHAGAAMCFGFVLDQADAFFGL